MVANTIRADANNTTESYGARPWKNAFAEDGGPISAARLRQGLRADPGTQARIACSSGPTPMGSGNLRVPSDYRTAYQFLGSWAVAADQGRGAKQIHTVYASPGTIAAYRKGGRFADGSVLVKEVLMAATGPMTTGTVSHAQTLSGWFVLMKDSKNRHPATSCGAMVGAGHGSMPPTLQKPRRLITRRIACPAMSRHGRPIGFMFKDTPH